ncbi:hypothetical protein Q0P93_15385, partial [Staphylococcus aureus]|nr:hypothetical protein [Staphylococcus aureus]
YGYDGINRLSEITYPNGDKATYSYGSHGKPSAVVATVDGTQRSIISQASWKATGARGWLAYGNGLGRGYNHDPEGRLTAMS